MKEFLSLARRALDLLSGDPLDQMNPSGSLLTPRSSSRSVVTLESDGSARALLEPDFSRVKFTNIFTLNIHLNLISNVFSDMLSRIQC